MRVHVLARIAGRFCPTRETTMTTTTTTRERNPDTGMVYRGACDLVHIADGKRAEMGEELARELDAMMRDAANWEAGNHDADNKPLCPGCYMVALFNAAVSLANDNGQSLSELGRSMSTAFWNLATRGESHIESIAVELDADA
jgi:hypothetical protein